MRKRLREGERSTERKSDKPSANLTSSDLKRTIVHPAQPGYIPARKQVVKGDRNG